MYIRHGNLVIIQLYKKEKQREQIYLLRAAFPFFAWVSCYCHKPGDFRIEYGEMKKERIKYEKKFVGILYKKHSILPLLLHDRSK